MAGGRISQGRVRPGSVVQPLGRVGLPGLYRVTPTPSHERDHHGQRHDRRADELGHADRAGEAGGDQPAELAALEPAQHDQRADHDQRRAGRRGPAHGQRLARLAFLGPEHAQGHGHGVRRDQEQPEDVQDAQYGHAGRRTRPPAALVAVAGAQGPDQHVAGHRGHGGDQGVGPGVGAVQADVGHQREQMPAASPACGETIRRPSAATNRRPRPWRWPTAAAARARPSRTAGRPTQVSEVVGAVHGVDVARASGSCRRTGAAPRPAWPPRPASRTAR